MPMAPPSIEGHTFIPLKDLGYQLGLTFHDFPKLQEELEEAGVNMFRIGGQVQVSQQGYVEYARTLKEKGVDRE